MQKFAKYILIATGVLALGAVASVLSANLYIESRDSQARIERKLSRVLHVPVKVTATSFSILSGLQVKGVTVQQGEQELTGNFFEAASFSAGLEYWPLLSRKLVIKQISVIQPQLAWYQTSKGKWRAPTVPEQHPSAAKPPEENKTPEPDRKAPGGKPFEVTVSKLAVSDGTVRLYDHNQHSLFTFLGVNAEGILPSATEIHGKAESATASIRDAVNFQNLRTEFSYGNKSFSLQPLLAKVAGGDFQGDFKMDTADPNNPISLKAEFQNADANRLAVDAGGVEGQITGQLSGKLELTAKTHKLKDFKGSGSLTLAHGRMQQYDFFQMLGQALQIEELTQLNLQQAELNYHFDDGKIFVDQLLLESPNLKVTASGTLRMDGKMNLAARLSINPIISRQLPGFISENFHPMEGNDLRYIDFDVTGSIDKPKTNLLELALGKKIEKQMGGLLNSLFGGKKKKESKKAPQAQPTPEAEPVIPAATPVPPPATPTPPPMPTPQDQPVTPPPTVSPTPAPSP